MEANEVASPSVAGSLKPLGSLAQAARGNELKQAQRILIVIGGLTLAVNGFALYNLPNEIQEAVRLNQLPPEAVEEFRQTVTFLGYAIYGSAAALGLLFMFFGLIIKRFPVPITITSLVLYVLATASFGILNPAMLLSGLFMKLIIIYALYRAIKAARAYEAHSRKPQVVEEPLG